MRQHTEAATITLVTFAERGVCLKARSGVTWHHMAYMTLNARYVHSNIHMPLVSDNMYTIVIKMLMVMSLICHCSAVSGTMLNEVVIFDGLRDVGPRLYLMPLLFL